MHIIAPKITIKRPEEATILCVQNTTNPKRMLQSTWATPCDGKSECLYNEDENNCVSPVWLLPIILLAMGLLLFGTLFCYLKKKIVNDLEGISLCKPLDNQIAINVVSQRLKKKYKIAVLIEKEECDLIKMIVKEETSSHGSEGSAMCCLKVLNKEIIQKYFQ